MASKSQEIVIRRVRANKKHAAHGGAWKVAFADFTLAMMAFFMVLWIMQVADQKERETVVKYLNGELYPSGDINPFDLRNIPSIIDLEGQPAMQQPVCRHRPMVTRCAGLRAVPVFQRENGRLEPEWAPS